MSNLLGIANAYWGQGNLSEALDYAQQALSLNKSMEFENDSNTGMSLAILSNIHHSAGDCVQALKLATQALSLLERCTSSNSPALISLLNNIGAIQIDLELYSDALLTFIRVSHICEKTLPEGHPKRMLIENNIQRISELRLYNDPNSYCHL
jgi:tetratricopeptide (TPR) repeat protein